MPRRKPDAVESYARDVVAGEIVAGKLVRLACERHLADLHHGHARGLRWHPAAAQRVFDFFSFLRLPMDGELDGKPFELEPFQKFIVGLLFGWKTADGFRRYRTAYIEQGKGNGKTPLAAGIVLFGLVADGEAAAECYSSATTQDQARILFRDASNMVNASPALRGILDVGLHAISYPRTGSFLKPLSSEHRGLDGKRPHVVAIDEFHEHPTAIVADKMRAGTKGRRQALIFTITNSGYDRTTACWAHHDYSAKLLRGLVENDAWFAYICQLDPCDKCEGEGHDTPVDGCKDCDDWRDEKTWLKANPGLGTILPAKYLREQVAEAKGMPSKEGIVRRLNFCQWTQIATHTIPMDKWDACKTEIDLGELRGAECYGGLDIGATSDFTAFPLLFPRDDAFTSPETGERLWRRSYTILPFFWLPANPRRRDERTTLLIDQWRRAGLVKTTPGDVVDYDVVLADIVELSQRYRILEIGFDRGFQGAQIGTNLIAHFGDKVLWTVPQGIISMNSPFREFLELIVTGRIRHDGNAVARWHCANTAAEQRGGLIKPSKDLSSEKIDFVTACCMALARSMLRPPADTAPSVNFI